MSYGNNIMHKRKLHAILWVDDYGSLKLRKKDVEWYHKNAGPISYALECDDQYPWSFDLILRSKSKDEFSYDYLGYHYHPIRWKGARLPKKIYDFLKLYIIVHSVLRAFKAPFSKRILRLRNVVFFLFIITLVLLYFIYFFNTKLFIILITLYAIVLGLVSLGYYVQHPKNWCCPKFRGQL